MLGTMIIAGSLALGACPPHALLYDGPAEAWVEALPVGNGRLGAMVFGGISEERIQINEDTVWTGAPHRYHHEGAVEHLEAIRALLAEGKQGEAEDLATAEFMSVPLTQKAYQPFVDLWISMPGLGDATDYRRSLNLNTAIAETRFTAGGVGYVRKVFASPVDDVLVVHVGTEGSGPVTLDARLTSRHEGVTVVPLDGNTLALRGGVKDGAIHFEARLAVRAEGGTVRVTDEGFHVEGAGQVCFVLAGATNYVNFEDLTADPGGRCNAALTGALRKDFAALRDDHVAEHQRLFNRVSLELPVTAAVRKPTDARVRDFANGDDPQLAALYFQFGRYLLISSSRPGGQPANLQGLWNDEMNPPWDSKYTVNINTEMNYWPAEATNLAECAEPLFAMLQDVSVTGRDTARAHYGCEGWVLHHNTDLWRGTAPINASNHGIWVTGGAWLCQHLWWHYLYSGDLDYLRETAYPVMKGAAVFFTGFLVEDPRTGWLISTPSNSPEIGGLVAGPTMDHQIIRHLFRSTIAAAETLDVDADLRARLAEMLPRIAPNQVGQHGQLQEWLEDRDDPNEHHRHVSHLWGVFPGEEITVDGTPELSRAARQSLEFRGDGGTGWSMGWKINFWARFQDGDHAYRLLTNQLSPERTYPNLFDAHPPFQIDGNFGATSGMTQMLLQDHAGVIHLLPALPSAWPEGRVTGLRARGGFEVDLAWEDGALTELAVRSSLGGLCGLRYGRQTTSVQTEPGGSYALADLFGPATTEETP